MSTRVMAMQTREFLFNGSKTLMNLGLIAYSGKHSNLVKSVIESGFESKNGVQAAVF